jgi:MHS family alpha-ketoglutarate permease-like MFS transporter
MTNSRDPLDTPIPSELPEAPDRRKRPVNLVAGTIGHFVEWYDWYIYGLLAAVFSAQIFPSHSAFASLIAALLTYAIGFVIRPFSGIIISPLADRYGRRAVLTLSVSGMALARIPDHRAHPSIRDDRLRSADSLPARPHTPRDLGRQ